MKKSVTETSRLYVTSDIYKDGVYFARTNLNKFARFYQNEFGWEIWIYPYRLRMRAISLTQVFEKIEFTFRQYWGEKTK